MPTRNQSWKPSHTHQNPSRKTKRSGKKYENAVRWYVMLEKREQKEWATKWIQKTKEKATARLKKYWIPFSRVQAKLAA
jgi:hypothetical protein